MIIWSCELWIRVHAVRKAKMKRLSYELLSVLRGIVNDSNCCALIFFEYT